MEQRYHWLISCTWVEELTKYLALVFDFSIPSGIELPISLQKSKEM